MRLTIILLITAFVALTQISGQIATGGSYTLDQAVTANGGGRSTDPIGNLYKVEGTSGQSAAGGSLIGGTYNAKSGFWAPGPFAPTAANVAVSGRVVTADGRGIRNVSVVLTGGTLTSPRIAQTGSFGYFTFDEIEVGQTYIVSVSSKRYGFGQPSQSISVLDNVTDLVFTATWQN
jgi:hypothetical protein